MESDGAMPILVGLACLSFPPRSDEVEAPAFLAQFQSEPQTFAPVVAVAVVRCRVRLPPFHARSLVCVVCIPAQTIVILTFSSIEQENPLSNLSTRSSTPV
jgi:hypothetical protein